jgi:hypothetical protein
MGDGAYANADRGKPLEETAPHTSTVVGWKPHTGEPRGRPMASRVPPGV